jgi:hypothetical protein
MLADFIKINPHSVYGGRLLMVAYLANPAASLDPHGEEARVRTIPTHICVARRLEP